MRTLSLICCLFFSTGVFAQSSLDSFYTPGTVWTEFLGHYFGLGQYRNDGVEFTITADTAFGGNTYHKLAATCIGRIYSATPPSQFQEVVDTNTTVYGQVGLIRVAGKKVYFINLDISSQLLHNVPTGVEILIFDYDLQAGNTVQWKNHLPKVQGIDSVLLPNNQWMRKYIFDSTGTGLEDWWYEGIGGHRGLLGSLDVSWTDWIGHVLICYQNPWVGYHENPVLPGNLAATCFSKTSLLQLAPLAQVAPSTMAYKAEMNIYPNPVTQGKLTIELTNVTEVSAISITDVTGRQVHAVVETSGSNYKVILPGAPGIYYITIYREHDTPLYGKAMKL